MVFSLPNPKLHSIFTQILKTIPFWFKVEGASAHTYCPEGKSFSFTTAQLVSDSSSVGHLAACIGCGREKETIKYKSISALRKQSLQTFGNP